MSRLCRFRRAAAPPPLEITPRDLEILRFVARFRFLASAQIAALIGGSRPQLLRRLQKLFHAGLLDRPRAQVRLFSEDGPQPIAYALSARGARLIAPEEARTGRPPRPDNRNVGQLHLQHTLLVAETMIALERAAKESGHFRLHDLTPESRPGMAFKWGVTVRHGVRGEKTHRVGLQPDRAFLWEDTHTGEQVLHFLEADRATMPIMRRGLNQTSFWRKLLAYEATWTQGLHRELWGKARFRVLTVTTSAARAANLATAADKLPRGRGLFVFADIAALKSAPGVLAPDRRTGRGNGTPGTF
jgi:DNA-binding Lrp family transcriptional regulator